MKELLNIWRDLFDHINFFSRIWFNKKFSFFLSRDFFFHQKQWTWIILKSFWCWIKGFSLHLHKQRRLQNVIAAYLDTSLLKHSIAAAVADRNFRTNKVVKLNMREIKSATGFRLPPNKCYQNNVFFWDGTLRLRLIEEILIACCNYQCNHKRNLPLQWERRVAMSQI